jgi:hypothetical protein
VISANVTLTQKDRLRELKKSLEEISRMEVYVGITEETAPREGDGLNSAQLAYIHTHGARSASMRKEMQEEMDRIASSDRSHTSDSKERSGTAYSVAHQMYVTAHGSPLYHTPPRPIIEPAIEAEGNKEPIAAELAAAAKAVLDGKPGEAKRHLNKAGQIGANAARAWFTDPRNGWPENAPATIKQKGSDKPLIDSDEMRKSITYVVKEKA